MIRFHVAFGLLGVYVLGCTNSAVAPAAEVRVAAPAQAAPAVVRAPAPVSTVPLFDAGKVMGRPRSAVEKLLGKPLMVEKQLGVEVTLIKVKELEVAFDYMSGKLWKISAAYPQAHLREAEIRQRLMLPEKGPIVIGGHTYILDCSLGYDNDPNDADEGSFDLADQAGLDANKVASYLPERKQAVEQMQRAAANIGAEFRVSLAGSDKATLRFADITMPFCTERFFSSLADGSFLLFKYAEVSERLQALRFRRIECRDTHGSATRDLPP